MQRKLEGGARGQSSSLFAAARGDSPSSSSCCLVVWFMGNAKKITLTDLWLSSPPPQPKNPKDNTARVLEDSKKKRIPKNCLKKLIEIENWKGDYIFALLWGDVSQFVGMGKTAKIADKLYRFSRYICANKARNENRSEHEL